MNDCWKCEKLKNELYCLENIRADFLKLKHVLFAQDENIRRSESQLQKDKALENENEALKKELSLLKSERLNLRVQSEQQTKLIQDLEKQVIQLKDDNGAVEKDLRAVQAKLEKLQGKTEKTSANAKRPTRATRAKKTSGQDEETTELLNMIESELAAVESSGDENNEVEKELDREIDGAVPVKGGEDQQSRAFLPSCSDLDTSGDERRNEEATVASASSSVVTTNNPKYGEPEFAKSSELSNKVENLSKSNEGETERSAISITPVDDGPTPAVSSARVECQFEADILTDITETLCQDTISQKTSQQSSLKAVKVDPVQFSPTKRQNIPKQQPRTPQRKPPKVSLIEKKAKIILDEDAGKDTFVQEKKRRAHAPKSSLASAEHTKLKSVPEKSGNNDTVGETKKDHTTVAEAEEFKPSTSKLRSKSDSSESDVGNEVVSPSKKRRKRSIRNISRRFIEDSDENSSDSPLEGNKTQQTQKINKNPEIDLNIEDGKQTGLTSSSDKKTDLSAEDATTDVCRSNNREKFDSPQDPVVPVSRLSDDEDPEAEEPPVSTTELVKSSETAEEAGASLSAVPELEMAPVLNIVDPDLERNKVQEEEISAENTALVEISNISCELETSFNSTPKDMSIHESDIDVSPTKLAQTFFNDSFDGLNKDLINSESDEDIANEPGVSYQRKDSVKIVEKLFEDMFQDNVGKLWFETNFELLDVEELDFDLPQSLNCVSLEATNENSTRSSFIFDNVQSFENHNDEVFQEDNLGGSLKKTEYVSSGVLAETDVDIIPEKTKSDKQTLKLMYEKSLEKNPLEFLSAEIVEQTNEPLSAITESGGDVKQSEKGGSLENNTNGRYCVTEKERPNGSSDFQFVGKDQNLEATAVEKFGQREVRIRIEEFPNTESRHLGSGLANEQKLAPLTSTTTNNQQELALGILQPPVEQENIVENSVGGLIELDNLNCVRSDSMTGDKSPPGSSILVKGKTDQQNFSSLDFNPMGGNILKLSTLQTGVSQVTSSIAPFKTIRSPKSSDVIATSSRNEAPIVEKNIAILSSEIVQGSIDNIDRVFGDSHSKTDSLDRMIRNSLGDGNTKGVLETSGCKTPDPETYLCSSKKVESLQETQALRRSPRIQKKTIQYLMEGFSVKLCDDLPESPKKEEDESTSLAVENVRKSRSRRQRNISSTVSSSSETTTTGKRSKFPKTSPIENKTSNKPRKVLPKAKTQQRLQKVPVRLKAKQQRAVILDSDTSSHVEEILSFESESVVELPRFEAKIGSEIEQLNVSDCMQTSANSNLVADKSENENVGQQNLTDGKDSGATGHDVSTAENIVVSEKAPLLQNEKSGKEVCTKSVLGEEDFSVKTFEIGGLSESTRVDDQHTVQNEVQSSRDTVSKNVDSSSEFVNTGAIDTGLKTFTSDHLLNEANANKEPNFIEGNSANLELEKSPMRTGIFRVQESSGSDVDSDEGGLCIDLGEEEQTSIENNIAEKCINESSVPASSHEGAETFKAVSKSQLNDSYEGTAAEGDLSGHKAENVKNTQPETENRLNEQLEVPALLFCGNMQPQTSQTESTENIQANFPQLIFCGNITPAIQQTSSEKENPIPTLEENKITSSNNCNTKKAIAEEKNQNHVETEILHATEISSLPTLSGNVNDEFLTDFGVEEVICGEVAAEEISKFLQNTPPKIGQRNVTKQKASVKKTIGAKKDQASTDDDPDFHPTLSGSGKSPSYGGRKSNIASQSQMSDKNCKLVLKVSEPQQKSDKSLKKISRKVYLNSVNQLRSLMKAKRFQNVREGEELIVDDDDDELDIKMEADHDDDDDEDFAVNKRASVNWTSNFTRSKAKRDVEDDEPPAKQSKGANVGKAAKQKSVVWNMEMKEESNDCKDKHDSASEKRRPPIAFSSVTNSESNPRPREVMIYVKKIVTDLKPEDSGDSERKRFYIEKLTKLFNGEKLTVSLLLGGIFCYFIQVTAKEEVQISRIGIAAELGVEVLRSVGSDLKDIWKEIWTRSASFISSEGKSKPKGALMFLVCLLSKLISDATANDEEKTLEEKYLPALRIFIYDVIVCSPLGWSEVVGLAFQEFHQLHRRYSEEYGDEISSNQIAHNVFMSSIECIICERTRDSSFLIQNSFASSALSKLSCDQSCIQKARHITVQYLLNLSYTSKASQDDMFVCLKAVTMLLLDCRSEDLDLFLKDLIFKYLKLFSSLCRNLLVLSVDGDVETFGRRIKDTNIVLEDEALKHADTVVQILAEVSLRPERPIDALQFFNAHKSLKIVLECLDTTHKKLLNPLSQNKNELYERFQESCCYALLKMHPIDQNKVMEALRSDESIRAFCRNAESNSLEIKKYSHLFLEHGISITVKSTDFEDLDDDT